MDNGEVRGKPEILRGARQPSCREPENSSFDVGPPRLPSNISVEVLSQLGPQHPYLPAN